jgi:hypothetical protein
MNVCTIEQVFDLKVDAISTAKLRLYVTPKSGGAKELYRISLPYGLYELFRCNLMLSFNCTSEECLTDDQSTYVNNQFSVVAQELFNGLYSWSGDDVLSQIYQSRLISLILDEDIEISTLAAGCGYKKLRDTKTSTAITIPNYLISRFNDFFGSEISTKKVIRSCCQSVALKRTEFPEKFTNTTFSRVVVYDCIKELLNLNLPEKQRLLFSTTVKLKSNLT